MSVLVTFGAGYMRFGRGEKERRYSMAVRLRSFNFDRLRVRHRDSLGELTPVTTDLDKQDSLFDLVPGLAQSGGNLVSLRSMNFPDQYLRHQDFRLKLQGPAGPDDEVFRK